MSPSPGPFEQLFLDETLGPPIRIVMILARNMHTFDDHIKLAVRRFGVARAGRWHSREKAAKNPQVAQFIIRQLVKHVNAGNAAIMVAQMADVESGKLTNERYNLGVGRALAQAWKRFSTARPLIDARYGQMHERGLRWQLATKVVEVATQTLGESPFDVETILNAQVQSSRSSGLRVADTVAWVIQRRGDARFRRYRRMIEEVKIKPDIRA